MYYMKYQKKQGMFFTYGRMEVVFFAALIYFYTLHLLHQYRVPGYTGCAPLHVFNFGQSEGPQVVNLFWVTSHSTGFTPMSTIVQTSPKCCFNEIGQQKQTTSKQVTRKSRGSPTLQTTTKTRNIGCDIYEFVLLFNNVMRSHCKNTWLCALGWR